MFDVDLGLPLGAGLLAAFNPCGFAMLPAYVSYFLGLESDDETNVAKNVMRAMVVGLTMTLGFMVVFGTIGVLTSTLVSSGTIASRVPYVTFSVGILMVPLGLAMLFGFEPKVNIKRVQAGGNSSQLPSIFLFGVSYAIVSLSCTIGIFLLVVADSFTDTGVVGGTANFLAYGAGMGLVIIVLSLGVALARNSVATNMRKVLPYVNKISGVMLMLAGVYLALYGWWEIKILQGTITDSPVVDLGERIQGRVTTWVDNVGETQLALATAIIVGGALVGAISSGMNRTDQRTVRGGFVAVWALIEIAVYKFDLLVLPLVRTVADAPERVGNWFTNPSRWPVLFEVLLAVFIGLFVWFRARRLVGQTGATDADSQTARDSASV